VTAGGGGSAAPLPVPLAEPARTGRLTALPGRTGAAAGPGAAPAPLAVAVSAGDVLTAEGTEAYLRGAEGVRVVPWGAWEEADIALVLDHEVTRATLARMERVGRESAARGRGLPILLVADRIGERDLVRAVRYGLVGVLVRQGAGHARILEAARSALDGGAPMPAPLVRTLVDSMRALAASGRRHGTGLSERETEVLRLLAEGLSTAEVAARLSYSERTIKNVLHEMITRLGLRNRTHAVAYAIRKGVV
jgi:DNA-binding NarL/FixJ family response regulator